MAQTSIENNSNLYFSHDLHMTVNVKNYLKIPRTGTNMSLQIGKIYLKGCTECPQYVSVN